MIQKNNRVAAVTGGRTGIGRGICLALAEQGWSVVVIDLVNDTQAEQTMVDIREQGVRAAFVQADIAQVEKADETVAAALAALGRIDVLVNNAGVQVSDRSVDILGTTVESYDRLMAVNMRGTFFLTQAFAKAMLAQTREAHAHPAIITISSSNALHAKTKGAEYCISKSGLSMMNKIMALQLAPHGIACYEVQPGLIKTEMNASMHKKYEPLVAAGLTPVARWGLAEDVGVTVATLAAGGLRFVTGEAIHVDGGMHIPKSLFENPFVRKQLEA
jgi:3-oxoacyl-[acyl-carrier protein] reductase